MRIAQVSPLYERIPPSYYGGTAKVVSYLTEELVRQGHQVTLFASADSDTSARLVAPCKRAQKLSTLPKDGCALHAAMLELVLKQASEFDLIHFHTDYLHFPASSYSVVPTVTTLHGRLDVSGLESMYFGFPRKPVVSISNAQRLPMPWLNWQRSIYYGLPRQLYSPISSPGKYLAFLGHISPENGVDRAVEIARRVGMPIKIAGRIEAVHRDYYNRFIKPLFDEPFVHYVGEIGDAEKGAFLGNAYALLFPIDQPEPSSVTLIESMASGTPVIAYRRGSVPEILDDGISGFICDGIDSAVKATTEVESLSRLRCRRVFEERFSVERMTRDYLETYARLAGNRGEPLGSSIDLTTARASGAIAASATSGSHAAGD